MYKAGQAMYVEYSAANIYFFYLTNLKIHFSEFMACRCTFQFFVLPMILEELFFKTSLNL